MSFEALPRMYITWDESSEDLDTFLRYQVYRRVVGETDWSKRARINDRGITFWDDTVAHSGVDYEYVVTQVIDVSGEEIESDYPSPVGGTVNIQSVFIHDVRAPENYVQMSGASQEVQTNQPISYVQPWSRRVPTAHVGHVLNHTYTFSMIGVWDEEDSSINKETWRALETLIDRQHEFGSVLMVRQAHDIAYFGVIESLRRSEAPILTTQPITFRETYYREDVD